MAPTHRERKDAFDQASAMLDSLRNMAEQISAQDQAMRHLLHTTLPLANRIKKLHEQAEDAQTSALHGSEHQLQKVMKGHLVHVPESAIEELPASMEDSGVLMVGEGKVDDEARERLAEKVMEVMSLMRATTEEMESALEQVTYTNYLHDMNVTDIFATANGDTAYGVNHTSLFPFADGNFARVTVANCRSLAVASCTLQAECSVDETNGTLAHELAKCDALTIIDIFEAGFLAGILAVLFLVAVMLCSAFRLLSERQVRVFGLGVVAVYLVVHFGGM